MDAEHEIATVLGRCLELALDDCSQFELFLVECNAYCLHHLALQVIEECDAAHLQVYLVVITVFLVAASHGNRRSRDAVVAIGCKHVVKEP